MCDQQQKLAAESLQANDTNADTRKTVIDYDPQEIAGRFEITLGTLDLQYELEELGCGLNSFFKRSRNLREFKAVAVVLWLLALEQSFPEQYAEFFDFFLARTTSFGRGRKKEAALQRISIYRDLAAEKKLTDFTPISSYMAEYFTKNVKNQKAINFKLTLTLRRLYKTIFDLLI